MTDEKKTVPLQIKILGWFGIIFGVLYVLVAVVNVVLSIMDRTYKDIDKNLLIGLYGVPILIISIGFKSEQKWGWIGYLAFLIFVIFWALMFQRDNYGLTLALISLAALAGILLPSVRHRFFTT